jgi:proline dehydrogenase
LRNTLLFPLAKHWIAGETYEDAIARAEQSRPKNVLSIINLLGEEVTALEQTKAATAEYLEILKAIPEHKINCCISLKPSHLGLTIDKKLYQENLSTILTTAKSINNFVWLDMEGSAYTTDTLDSYLEFRKRFDNIGVAIQAYLKRSEEDVNRILDAKGMIRLCKGAYRESAEIALKGRDRISQNYSKLMQLMFERGSGFAIASHDEKLIEQAVELSKKHPVGFEFEMLMGIRDPKKVELAQRGFRISEYIPYGKGWWGYSVRRIQEHKSNILLLARSLLSG